MAVKFKGEIIRKANFGLVLERQNPVNGKWYEFTTEHFSGAECSELKARLNAE